MSADPSSMIPTPPDGAGVPTGSDGEPCGAAESRSRSRVAGFRGTFSSTTGAFAVVISLALSALLCDGDAAAQENASDVPSAIERILWESVRDGDDIGRLRRFLEAFPDGRFAEQARALLRDAADADGEASAGSIGRAAEGGNNASDQVTDGATSTSEDRPLADAPILFDRPIAIGSGPPRSLRELVQGNPLFSPVEGLEEEYWANEKCDSCHEWTRENLCMQGEFYAARGEEALARHRHPYGGSFKRAVRRWAEDGCR